MILSKRESKASQVNTVYLHSSEVFRLEKKYILSYMDLIFTLTYFLRKITERVKHCKFCFLKQGSCIFLKYIDFFGEKYVINNIFSSTSF